MDSSLLDDLCEWLINHDFHLPINDNSTPKHQFTHELDSNDLEELKKELIDAGTLSDEEIVFNRSFTIPGYFHKCANDPRKYHNTHIGSGDANKKLNIDFTVTITYDYVNIDFEWASPFFVYGLLYIFQHFIWTLYPVSRKQSLEIKDWDKYELAEDVFKEFDSKLNPYSPTILKEEHRASMYQLAKNFIEEKISYIETFFQSIKAKEEFLDF